MEERAFDLLNCITVVPGALGAWRTEAIEAAGGITSDTVAEDADLTIAIRRLGWRISYDEEAIAWTEAPETPGALTPRSDFAGRSARCNLSGSTATPC